VIGQNLVIAGPGAGVMTVECLDGKSSVFSITNGTVSIAGLTIANGTGGISNSATLSVSDCLITGNTGSGVINSLNGMLKVNKCAIVGNSASRYVAGGVYNNAG
jgi:hypothetical protein